MAEAEVFGAVTFEYNPEGDKASTKVGVTLLFTLLTFPLCIQAWTQMQNQFKCSIKIKPRTASVPVRSNPVSRRKPNANTNTSYLKMKLECNS